MTRKKVFVGSGGAAHSVSIAAMLCSLRTTYDVYYLTSGSSLFGLLYAAEKFTAIEHEFLNTSNRDIYGLYSPIHNNKFNLTKFVTAGLVAMARKKRSIYKGSKVIEKKIRTHFKLEDYKSLIARNIDVVVTNQNLSSTVDNTHYVSILDPLMTYDTFVRAAAASAAIPVLFEPFALFDYVMGDGGVQDNIPTGLLEKHIDDTIHVWLSFSKEHIHPNTKNTDTIPQIVMNMIASIRNHMAYNDIASIKSKDTTIFFSDNHKGWSFADFNRKRMRHAWNKATGRALHGSLNSLTIQDWREYYDLPPL